MHKENLNYSDGDLGCAGYIVYDDSTSGRRPCVLISHTWAGIGDFEKRAAERLAGLGYAGFAIDMYGGGKRGSTPEENAALMQPFMADRALLRRRILAAASAVKQHPVVDPSRLGGIGFCFGGLCTLDLARSTEPSVRGVVSFHGLLHAPNIGPQARITASILMLHGYDDPMATPEHVLAIAKEFGDAKADWQLHAYGGTMHAFTNPAANTPERGLQYNARAAERAWTSMESFFREIFG